MTRGRAYPDERRAKVLAALLTGESVTAVAAVFAIPERTVRDWGAALRSEIRRQFAAKKSADLGELVAGYLVESLGTLAAQARFTRDETWLRQQNAADLAVLHGMMVDKAIRILAALDPVGLEAA